ncbi:hypothetical protein [Caballeronia cordobensis]|uniref:hypothetical protein n=1 Tax=Caballeronia cordobensis TaxID=1353886 RepID=UPI00128F0A97|nr:hypothetical protein [Caballeronia cordobensis]
MALKRSIFPILEFDEWELSLTRGSALDPKWLVPGESLVSILWKFASANVLPGEALMHLISPRVGPPEGVAPVNIEIALRRLRQILRLPTDVLRVSMLGEAFHGRAPQAFRYCRLCASHGYHSVLYQLEDEDRCTAHQQLLRRQCPYCGGVTPYIVNASVIAAPFRCASCHSHFSYGQLPLFSTISAMRRRDRDAIRRRLLL